MTDTPTTEIPWGPTGELVYNRTYSRVKPSGAKETWPETVARVVEGNLALVDERYQLPQEREDLIRLITEFKILPAGRHLWASGVKNAQHLFNCWVSGWPQDISDHFQFTFMRLMEGGGVGANYSNMHLEQYGPVQHFLNVEIVCDPDHPDYELMKDAGILSTKYDSDWDGAYAIEDSREGWADALVDLIDTHYRKDVVHLHRVYDVTRVRQAGAKLKTFGGVASGPKPFAEMLQKVSAILSDRCGHRLTGIDAMSIDHAIAQCVVAGGVRRSARMAMMHWADAQIEDFIHCKAESGDHWTTNISVEVDEEFWRLTNAGLGSRSVAFEDVPRQKRAHAVLQEIATGAVRNGEPGMWDSSYSNKGEPNRVVCTNPCGEITLEAWEPCNLGHINLAGFVTDKGKTDYLGLLRAHELVTRFLIRATFSQVGDPKSREVLDRNRRIGVGHLGVASYLAKTGVKYSEAPVDRVFTNMLRELAKEVDRAAEVFSHELRIPIPVKKRTIAPTGTVAKMPGVSEGIHPIFSRYFLRRVRFNQQSDFAALADLVNQGYEVEDDLFAPNTAVVTIPTKDTLLQEVSDLYGEERAEEIVESADELSLFQMLRFQSMYQTAWADNAVSFTANVDPDLYSADDVAEVLNEFAGRIKGSTIFPEASFPQAPYERISKQDFESYDTVSIADGVDENCANGACPIK
ncbi:ribonucleotide reductase [Gordonia phage Nedarya]|nr:ribonucleotide reductase [Gordonia phage Nedarya]